MQPIQDEFISWPTEVIAQQVRESGFLSRGDGGCADQIEPIIL